MLRAWGTPHPCVLRCGGEEEGSTEGSAIAGLRLGLCRGAWAPQGRLPAGGGAALGWQRQGAQSRAVVEVTLVASHVRGDTRCSRPQLLTEREVTVGPPSQQPAPIATLSCSAFPPH